MDNLLAKTAELLANAAADPDRVLRWVLIYFGLSSLGVHGRVVDRRSASSEQRRFELNRQRLASTER
jgi:streptomycin 6-kinase